MYLLERVTDPNAVCKCRYCPREPTNSHKRPNPPAPAPILQPAKVEKVLAPAPPYDPQRAFIHRRGEVVEAAGQMACVVTSTRSSGSRRYTVAPLHQDGAPAAKVEVEAMKVVPGITALAKRAGQDQDSPDVRVAKEIAGIFQIK